MVLDKCLWHCWLLGCHLPHDTEDGSSYEFCSGKSLEKGTEHEDEYMISEKELLVNR